MGAACNFCGVAAGGRQPFRGRLGVQPFPRFCRHGKQKVGTVDAPINYDVDHVREGVRALTVDKQSKGRLGTAAMRPQ